MVTDLLSPTKAPPRRFTLGECEPILASCPSFSPFPVGIIPGSCPAVIDLADVTEAGDYCWSCSGTADYPAATIDGAKVRLHRFICDTEADVVDHLSGDQTDNRSCNLRPATYRENRANVAGSGTRDALTAELWEQCADCSLPCLEYPDPELGLVVVADATYPGAERAADYLDGYNYLGPTTPDALAEVTEGADAVLIVSPTWRYDWTASGLLDRLGPWLPASAELDQCAALMRPGLSYDQLKAPDVSAALETLAVALKCGCEEGALCFYDSCEDIDPESLSLAL